MSAMDLPFALPVPGRDYGGSAITSNLELQSPPLLVCNFLRFYYATITAGPCLKDVLSA